MTTIKILTAAAMCLTFSNAAMAQNATAYQKPPVAIEQLLDAPSTPVATLSPDRTTLLVEQPQTFPTIADVAQPRFRLAGLRFNPASNGPSREFDSVGLSLQPIAGGAAKRVAGLPARLRATHALWSPDSKHIAFVQHSAGALELWLIDVAAARGHRVGLLRLNAVLGAPCAWMPNSAALLCNTVPAGRGRPPVSSAVPTGPHVSENLGKVSPAPTFEDMLTTPDDEAVFEFYATSQLTMVPLTGPTRPLAVKGLLQSPRPSPDGRFTLVQQLHRPFSYSFPAQRFPEKTSVLTLKSGSLKLLFDRPLVDNLPISNDAVPAGPRDYAWRSDAPATLAWVEAADGGDPAVKTEVRDRLFASAAPFDAKPTPLLDLSMRFRGVEWGTDHLAIATEARFSDRQMGLLAFDPSTATKPVTLYKGSSQDRYHNPGRPVTHPNASGHPVLQFSNDGDSVYLFADGASPTGDKPFVALMPASGGKETVLWRSDDPFYASPIALLPNNSALIRRESQTVPPNYFRVALSKSAEPTQLTNFPSPYADIKLPTKQLLKYKRADGVELTATLWLPAGYDKSQGPLPTLMEAYPAEFKTRSAASQVSGSPNRFPRITWGSPVFFTQTGYAVLENASIPIVGEGKAQPNDTYVEQLVASAKAAIDYGASLGVVDPKRVAVMGHSYGAFMTANLLAHSNLFRAGIARSGAYNRSLTPFGFQNEERTYWQAPDVYYKMSPFAYADKIKTPILLIHGEADDNTGTYPIQSERFYAALKGHGATVRLVFLPLEAHGYEAHESLSHMLWEMDRWLDTYVKPATPTGTKSGK
ncbi:MAG: prolyl oligopeptidase family serine peptidase [Acidobacteriaceae bacterium]